VNNNDQTRTKAVLLVAILVVLALIAHIFRSPRKPSEELQRVREPGVEAATPTPRPTPKGTPEKLSPERQRKGVGPEREREGEG